MKPVLFTINNIPFVGNFPISSFGLFLLLGVLLSSFVVWRLARFYDINEEKVIDLILLTFIGSILGARITFVLLHLNLFDTIQKVFFINKYPGLSFWGGLLGGYLFIRYFSAKFKLKFWQIADFAVVGLFLGLSFGALGCLFGSCQYGLLGQEPFAINQVGVVGRRFPIQLVESLLYLIYFFILWKAVLKFHVSSQIAVFGLILLGFTKFILEFFYGNKIPLFSYISLGTLLSTLLIIYALKIHYSKNISGVTRSPLADIKLSALFLFKGSKRRILVGNMRKSFYNFKVDSRILFNRAKRNIFKLLNIKPNPTKF